MSKTAYLRDTLKFDMTEPFPDGDGIHIRCSCCAAMVINGIPCHERTCPNETHECSGCNDRVSAGVRYCNDCR